MERARSMLSGANLDRYFWSEAVSTACYLVNTSPCSAIVDKTRYEVWIGRNPSISHLRFICCEAFVHVPQEKHFKFDPKVQKCIFIGYGENINYNLWNPLTRKMVFSKDVIFGQFRSYSGEEKPKEKDETKIVHFETKIEKKEDAHVEENSGGFEDGEEEEGSKSLDDLQDEHVEEEE